MKRTYAKNNITVIEVENKEEGNKAAFELLRGIVDKDTILFLSGGSSPINLYKMIVSDQFQQIKPAAVATVDERWGPPGHEASNEEMFRKIGLYDYFKRSEYPDVTSGDEAYKDSRRARRGGQGESKNHGSKPVVFYFKKLDIEVLTILHGILNRSETAYRYDIVLQGVFERFKHSAAIMGIGSDGHTAGLAPSRADWNNPAFEGENKQRLVIDFENNHPEWQYAERITITPNCMQEIKNFIVLGYGSKKRRVLKRLFNQNLDTHKFPATIFKELNGKIYLVTDQKL